MTTDYSYAAIAAFVPPMLREKVANCSRLLEERYKSWFVLNENEFPPHVTIWIAYVPTKNLEALSTVAQKVLRDTPPFEICVGDVKIEDGGYISLEVEVDNNLHDLHRNLLKNLNEFREGYLAQKYLDTMHNFSPEQQVSLKKYGTRAAGDLYAPHITVGVPSSEFVLSVRQQSESMFREMTHTKFLASELTLFRQGKPGKSIELIKSYPLLS